MITKHISIIIFLFSSTFLYCQNKVVENKIIYYDSFSPNKKIIENKIYYDVESLLPVYKTTTDSTHDPIRNIDYYWGKKIIRVSTDIEYIGGASALLRYQDSIYWSKQCFNDNEVNGSCLYTILFDKNLRIKDIRIIKRSAYDNSKYNYDKVIKDIVLSTEGNWKRINDTKSKWYFQLGRFYVRP